MKTVGVELPSRRPHDRSSPARFELPESPGLFLSGRTKSAVDGLFNCQQSFLNVFSRKTLREFRALETDCHAAALERGHSHHLQVDWLDLMVWWTTESSKNFATVVADNSGWSGFLGEWHPPGKTSLQRGM